MSEHPLTVFVVDDDPAARLIVRFELDDPAYRVHEFDSAADCLASLSLDPDLLLLDVEMPDMDGIALCRALREAGHGQAQVIFISGHDDLETRLKAYDAGGDDFMVKPYASAELMRKVRVAERALLQHQDLSSQADFARQAAFSAMSSMGEMGAVLEFMRQSFACAGPDDLARAVFQALAQYGLHGLLELDEGGRSCCYSSRGDCSALEYSILGHTRTLQRIFQFRDRLAINYAQFTLLVLDLPLDDPDKVGRLRDHLAILAEAGEARMQAMAGETQRRAQAEGIGQAAAELTRTWRRVETCQSENRVLALAAVNQYMEDMERAFVHLGLSENQEAELLDMARLAMGRIVRLLGEDQSLGESLRGITDRLQGLTSLPDTV